MIRFNKSKKDSYKFLIVIFRCCWLDQPNYVYNRMAKIQTHNRKLTQMDFECSLLFGQR